MPEQQTCRQCGCTDDRACPGGCSWVAPDLCSACKPELDPSELLSWGIVEMMRRDP